MTLIIDKFHTFTSLLSSPEKKRLKIVVAINTIGALIDMIGVAVIFPFMSVVENRNKIEEIAWLKMVYEGLNFSSQSHFLIFLGVSVIGFTLLSLSFRVLSSYISMRFTFMTVASMSQRYFNKAMKQNYLWFLRHSNSELNTKILGEVENYAMRALFPFIQLIAGCVLTVVMMAMVIAIDVKIAVTIFSSCAVFFIVVYLFVNRHLNAMGKLRTAANSERFSVIIEAFEGIKTVKIFNLEATLSDRFQDAAVSYALSQKSIVLVKQLPKNALEGFAVILIVLSILAMMVMYGYDSIQISLFSLYALAGYRMIPAVQNIFNNASTLHYSQYAVDQLKRMEASFASAELSAPAQEINFLNKDISIKNLSFSQKDGKNVLNNISLEIPHKSRIAIVGPSGCGKTSLIDHLTGVITPVSGQIKVGDTILNEDNAPSFQKHIGYVPQDIYLLKDTIAHNISLEFNQKNIDEDKIWACLDVVNLREMVENEMPDQLQTIIGDGHKGFSGGQRQRLGIARALYRSNSVIIMDEATSALDVQNERKIMNRVSEFCKDMTMVLITHRTSSIQNVDIVLEMDNGQIVSTVSADMFIKQSNYKMKKQL